MVFSIRQYTRIAMSCANHSWRVLVFPAGTENGLEIWKSLITCKEVELFAATIKGINHTEYVYEKCNYVRSVSDVGWIQDIKNIVTKNKIDFIYPANSIIIDALLSCREQLGCRVALPETSIVMLTRSKIETIRALQDKIPVPITYTRKEDITQLPVFVKPNRGYGSQEAYIIDSFLLWNMFIEEKSFEKYVVQEYLPGREYTVDCF